MSDDLQQRVASLRANRQPLCQTFIISGSFRNSVQRVEFWPAEYRKVASCDFGGRKIQPLGRANPVPPTFLGGRRAAKPLFKRTARKLVCEQLSKIGFAQAMLQ